MIENHTGGCRGNGEKCEERAGMEKYILCITYSFEIVLMKPSAIGNEYKLLKIKNLILLLYQLKCYFSRKQKMKTKQPLPCSSSITQAFVPLN